MSVPKPRKLELPEPPAPPWTAPARPIACAIVGLGARGQSFARRLAELDGVRLAWLVDAAPDRLAAAVDRLNGKVRPRLAGGVEQILADRSLDAVFVATPDDTHRRIAVAAFKAGKHVFVEKPLATTLDDARAILAAWRASGAVLQLGYVLRETPFYRAVRSVVASGLLGRIHALRLADDLGVEHGASFMRRWHRRAARSGGLMVHKGCHDLDLACWLLDETPRAVASFGGAELFARRAPAPFCSMCPERVVCPYVDRGAYEARTPAQAADPTAFGLDVCVFGAGHDIVDNQVVAFELAGGARGAFSLGMQNPLGSRRTITLAGDRGRLEGVFDDGNFQVVTRDGGPPWVWSDKGVPAGGHKGGDAGAVRTFLDACAGRGPPGVTDAADALRGLAFALAAEAARREDRVVEVSEDLTISRPRRRG